MTTKHVRIDVHFATNDRGIVGWLMEMNIGKTSFSIFQSWS
jgi:hypothetical protein